MSTEAIPTTPVKAASPLLDLEGAKRYLEVVLEVNTAKKGSVKARTIEYGFVQALNLVYGEVPYLRICAISGRSILD